MFRTGMQIIGSAIGIGVILWLGFVVSFRTKFRPVQDTIRRFNRATSRVQLRTAGQPGAYASVIRHVGRNSGAAYRTPVGVVESERGLLIALPYGPGTDWVRNVMNAGEATVEHRGETFRVHQPEFIPIAEANPMFATKEQRMHHLFGVNDFLVLQRTVDA